MTKHQKVASVSKVGYVAKRKLRKRIGAVSRETVKAYEGLDPMQKTALYFSK